jgi:hypothetical protein
MSGKAGQALAAIRGRVQKHISVPVSDAEALKLCFTCATVESDALLDLSHSRVVQSEANANRRALALTEDEFETLLHDSALTQLRMFNLTSALSEEERDPERREQNASIEAALGLTLSEKTQKALWDASPRARAYASLAELREEGHVECLHHALGEVLGSDLRRVDDLRAHTQDVGIDIMSVAALISTVCTQIVS